MPDAEALDTMSFTEMEGRTTLTILVRHASKGDRDAHLASAWRTGLQDGLELLEELATSLR